MRGNKLYAERVQVRISKEQLDNLKKSFEQYTGGSFSCFVRKRLLNQRVDCYSRNQSFDEFNDQMIAWRNEMRDVLASDLLPQDKMVIFLDIQQKIQEGINKMVDLCMSK